MKVKIIGPSLISVTCEQPRKYRETKRVRVEEPGYSYLKTVNDGVIETSFEVEIEIGSLQELRMENDAAGIAMDEMRPRFERMQNRHENGTAPRAVTAYQLFQTPVELAHRMAAMLGNPSRALEPEAGLGRLLDALPIIETVAVEVAPQLCAELFKQERQNVRLLQRDFLTVSPDEIGRFDAILMNPPFHMRDDIRHIVHALQFLQPGGILSALCLDTHHREATLKPMAQTWEKIPAGCFKAEGTQVATVMLSIRK